MHAPRTSLDLPKAPWLFTTVKNMNFGLAGDLKSPLVATEMEWRQESGCREYRRHQVALRLSWIRPAVCSLDAWFRQKLLTIYQLACRTDDVEYLDVHWKVGFCSKSLHRFLGINHFAIKPRYLPFLNNS